MVFSTGMLTRSAGVSILIGGAIVLISKFFVDRKERVEEEKKEEDE